MRSVHKSVLVPYSAQQMFDLVERVEDYPKFLPWCGGTRILQRTAEHTLVRIDIDYRGVRAHFTTCNRNQPPDRLVIELRDRMASLLKARQGVEQHRHTVLRTYAEKLAARIQELIGAQADKERILQEAALLVDRSDIQEELVRLNTHVKHFLGLLDEQGEIGKKLDFLLQEMNRESNTLLSKTSGLAGDALKITEMGLLMKSEIEKCREQVQNIE